MIRILHIFHRTNCGGAENMIMNLYRKIDRTKIQFDFLIHTDEECFFDKEIRELGGKIYSLPKFSILSLFSYIKSLRDFFKNHKEYSIIHGHIEYSEIIYLYIARKFNLFTIAHSHTLRPKNFSPLNMLYRLYLYPTRFIANHFFACSIRSGEQTYGKRVIKKNNFKVLNNAFNVKRYTFDKTIRDSIRKELGIDDKYVIGHVGRFSEVKNHTFLLKTFKSLLNLNQNSVLLLIGDGELRKKIENEAKNLGIIDNIKFLGLRQDVNQLLMAMDCFVFPSLYEGLGIVIMEAQATGLKCIISDIIPTEVDCTDLIIRKSLSESSEEWARTISKTDASQNREKYNKILTEYGYNINDTTKWLENFYLEHSKGEYHGD